MLADSSVFSSSPWQNDQLFPNADLDLLEAEIEKMRNENSLLSESLLNDVLPQGSGGHLSLCPSATSSDCDYLDINLDDDLDGTVFNLMDVGQSNDVNWSTWMMSDDEETDAVSVDRSSIASTSSLPSPKAKRKCKRTTKKSKTKDKRKSSTVEQLQHIISTQLGVREQLDVLRIINPQSSNVSPTDKHFVIDLDNVTEEKLELVKDYVNRHSNSRSKCTASAQKQLTKLTKKQQAAQQREERQQQIKLQRQSQKEKRSGLFKKEQKLSIVVSVSREEDEDVDILS